MKLGDWANIGEIISAIAIVISLIYVGYEVRQNTLAVRATAYQAIHDAEDQFWETLVSDAAASSLWDTGLHGGLEAITPDEQARFTLTARRLIYLYQNVHYQRRKGMVDDELWGAWVTSLGEFVAQPGFLEVLDQTKPHLSDPFNEFLRTRYR